MAPSFQHGGFRPDPVDELRRRFPGHDITEDGGFKPKRIEARARDLATRPWCVISSDPGELAAALAAGTGCPR